MIKKDMKRISPILFVIVIIQSCSIIKNVNQKEDSKTQKIESNQHVEINLYNMPENFIWRKGQAINLKGEIYNNSEQEIILIAPKTSKEYEPEAFKVKVSDEFVGSSCEYAVGEAEYPKSDNFWRILPGEKKEFQIFGANYFLNYCNDEPSMIESVDIYIQYLGRDYQYNKESYFIKENYDTLSELEYKEILEKVESTINKYFSKLSVSEKDKQRKLFTNKYIKQKDNCTPEEQELIIRLFNKSFKKTIKSNVISIKIEN